MLGLSALEQTLSGSGSASPLLHERILIKALEHETVLLPPTVVQADGTLDVYDDVLNRFRLTYHKTRPSIQCGGWVGYIPINDKYALQVSTRVPVGNLERLVAMAAGYAPSVLQKYKRLFASTGDRPEALFDILADQFLLAFDRIWEHGLIKTYNRDTRISANPSGRIMPFETEWLTARSGRPTAKSSSFRRTPDFGPNRMLRYAFEKLFVRNLGLPDQSQRARTLQIRTALLRLGDVRPASASEVTPLAVASYLKRLPAHHEQYTDALITALLIVSDRGLSIRHSGGIAELPSILIDMATVFESYMRHVLGEGLARYQEIAVKDGNKDGATGAKLSLYNSVPAGSSNPDATPDIVIEVNGRTALIIDAKYKPAPKSPDRNDVNQAIVYGARYDTPKVMLLHAGRPSGRMSVELCGSIGRYQVYNGMMDLNAPSIEKEEMGFVAAVLNLLK
ncbi:restriction endonuclease [Kaistia defluvii]|uniref:5-methylcytosine restriction system specificity protein McrC n=1 Tax=Kaistia defluvii TaxID=410841 RepID=UPI00224ECD85|nr:restriction endonuclease [Kaistia defluvii]MCX5518424.1 restriction endonuclease [Kaistia defluvii]